MIKHAINGLNAQTSRLWDQISLSFALARDLKLSINVVLYQTALHQGNQVTVVFWHNEPHRAGAPGMIYLELRKESSMILVGRIKGHQRPAIVF
jgi:TFIIF-interacting CTD phosphatase-like protein